MDDAGENLKTINQTWPGTAKEGVAVDGENFAGFDGRQVVPALEMFESCGFVRCSLDVEAARH